jgi:hypothetical protein
VDVDYFDWDDEDFDQGNTRHIRSAGYEPEDVEEAFLGHAGPIEITKKKRRPMIRATMPDGEEVIIVFEIDADADVVVVRPITVFNPED